MAVITLIVASFLRTHDSGDEMEGGFALFLMYHYGWRSENANDCMALGVPCLFGNGGIPEVSLSWR